MYFDAAATTPLDPRAWESMVRVCGTFGNHNSNHVEGAKARKLYNELMRRMATVLGVHPLQLVLTHGGTNGNRKVLWAATKRWGWGAIQCTGIEHSSVRDELSPTQYVSPDGKGLLPTTQLVAKMYANNETGRVLEPFENGNALVLEDWVQGAGKVPFDFSLCDFATVSAHKFHGPKGVGLLYIKEPNAWLDLSKDTHTKDLTAAAGMATALELITPESQHQLAVWTAQIETYIQEKIPDVKVIDVDQKRVPGITSVAIPGLRGSMVMQALSRDEGISVSTGSACNQDLLSPTDVLRQLEPDAAYQYPVRIGLHRMLTQEQIDDFCEIFVHTVQALRSQNAR